MFSGALFTEVGPGFFRVLTGASRELYADALDALEREATRRNQGLDREEALALIEEAVENHQAATVGDEQLSQAATTRDMARLVLENLRQAGWVEEEQKADWQRVIHFDPNGAVMMQALRKIAWPDAAVFSDKVVNVCATLSHFDTLAEDPWAQVESCIAGLQSGLAELRGMQKSIERHTRQQLAATSLRENLELLFDRFAERIGRTCYAQLVHARLPTRLAQGRRATENELAAADMMEKMQTEVLRRDPALSPETAMARVRLRVEELRELLEQVEPLAEAIDRRTAEFTRRSQARFRYLQETTSENRAQVQSFFETLNQAFAGRTLNEINALDLPIPALQIHEIKIPGGLESLYTPRLRREAGEIEPLEEAEPGEGDQAIAELEMTMRDSLTVGRANRFVESLPGRKGERISSADLLRTHVRTDDDLADVIACLLHARSADARFLLEVPRRESDADAAEFDARLGYRVERFELIKK